MRTQVIRLMVQISHESSSSSTSFDPLPSSLVRTCFSVFVCCMALHGIGLFPTLGRSAECDPEGLTPLGGVVTAAAVYMSFTEEVTAMYVCTMTALDERER